MSAPHGDSALDTFAHLELACDAMFDREPEWYSDDDECVGGDCDEEGFDDDEDQEGRRLQTPPLPATGFMSIDTSTPSSVFSDVLSSSEGYLSPVDLDFASRIFQTSFKRERDPSPILGGEPMATAVPVAAVASIDIDAQWASKAPVSLDQFHLVSAHPQMLPTTTSAIFGARGSSSKAAKKQKENSSAAADNSDALSCASSRSAVSTGTTASFATTISNGSYGFMPFNMNPALNFQVEMWRCKDCQLFHPADYKGCGRCLKKREEVEQPPPPPPDTSVAAASQHHAAAAAAMVAMGWYSNPLSQTYSPQSLYSPHAMTPLCGGGGNRPPSLRTGMSRISQSSPNTTRRGENVKDNPQMQKKARDGQKHWHDKVQQVCALTGFYSILLSIAFRLLSFFR